MRGVVMRVSVSGAGEGRMIERHCVALFTPSLEFRIVSDRSTSVRSVECPMDDYD